MHAAVLHGHAVGALRRVASAREEVGLAEGYGEEGAECDGQDGGADPLRLPLVVAGQKGAEELEECQLGRSKQAGEDAMAHQHDQRDLREHPSQVAHQDEEASLEDHPLRQDDTCPDFFPPPFRPVVRDV